jgi:hypothetical protein
MKQTSVTMNFSSFFDFCQSVKGTIIYRNGKTMSKAAVYWGVMSNTTDVKELRVVNKPGWENGSITNFVHYSLWLNGAKF